MADLTKIVKVGKKVYDAGKQGIETVLDDASKYIRSATNAVTKNRRIAKIAKERGYRRTGAGNFLPQELFYFDKTSRGGRYKLKDPNFRYKNDVEIKFDEDGVPISHTITPKTYVSSEGKVAKFDKEGRVSYYVKDPNLGVGKYTRSEKELELVRERMFLELLCEK